MTGITVDIALVTPVVLGLAAAIAFLTRAIMKGYVDAIQRIRALEDARTKDLKELVRIQSEVVVKNTETFREVGTCIGTLTREIVDLRQQCKYTIRASA
jgi:hypothetical protein